MRYKKTTLLTVPVAALVFMGASCSLVPINSDLQTNTNIQLPATNNASNLTVADSGKTSTDKTGFKKYVNTRLGLSIVYPEHLELSTSEDLPGISLKKYYDQRSIDGTSGTEPDGISVWLAVVNASSPTVQYGKQRSEGVYLTSAQQKEVDESYKDSSFPQPKLVSTEKIAVGDYHGYVYRSQVAPPSRPVTEMTNYGETVEYYVPIQNDNILTVTAHYGFGEKYDENTTIVKDIVRSLELQ